MIQTLPLNANVMQDFIGLFSNVGNINWKMILMWIIGAVLVYLAIKKEMEPTLLLPMGFGTILVNLPMPGAVTQVYEGVAESQTNFSRSCCLSASAL